MRRAVPAMLSHSKPPSIAAIGHALAGSAPQGFAFPRGAALGEAGRPMPAAYLVTHGLVALLARAPGGAVAEVGLVGPGGLVGHLAAFGFEAATSDAVALTAVRGLALAPANLMRLASENDGLRRELTDYAAARMSEVERICVCAASHSVEQRLARWLASAAALLGDRPIEVTHAQLALLLGVRRASVTVSLHLLEGERAVRCRRGRVEIRDRGRLEAASCGCQHAALAYRAGG